MWVRFDDILIPIGCGGFLPMISDFRILLFSARDDVYAYHSPDYGSHERAAEVLNELQQFIVDCHACKDDKMFVPVFTMPKE
ncbi:hypothetical protein SAMN05446037_100638 [Anaerovirgula multivorans]|uniref:Uncharacterized protein n=1 Tax=Anaerovirgula multivorans TaxID=312168 RepID=A0A239CMY7_9FIRM|nr:hypothetical protein [Anaerovirgula multivorans]SNS21051.1 hypothetical protein SAMN05446037_100638 [Anaerovirgula multivorans]